MTNTSCWKPPIRIWVRTGFKSRTSAWFVCWRFLFLMQEIRSGTSWIWDCLIGLKKAWVAYYSRKWAKMPAINACKRENKAESGTRFASRLSLMVILWACSASKDSTSSWRSSGERDSRFLDYLHTWHLSVWLNNLCFCIYSSLYIGRFIFDLIYFWFYILACYFLI